MIEQLMTNIERSLLGNTWAIRKMSIGERLRFFRDTGEWPGNHSQEATAMFIESNIRSELAEGNLYCAQRKMARAEEAGLNIHVNI